MQRQAQQQARRRQRQEPQQRREQGQQVARYSRPGQHLSTRQEWREMAWAREGGREHGYMLIHKTVNGWTYLRDHEHQEILLLDRT